MKVKRLAPEIMDTEKIQLRIKIFRISFWLFFILALGLFYISLRTKDAPEAYTFMALGGWLLAWGSGYFLKKERKKLS